MRDEESKAIREVAKTTGKGIDAATEFGKFVAAYVHGPLEAAMGMLSDHLNYVRWERQQRLIERALEFRRQRGLDAPTRAVPLKVLIPALQNAVLEENDELQDLWARLLVNAGDPNRTDEVRRMHVDMLEQLSSLDARILSKLYEHADREFMGSSAGLWTYRLPDEVVVETAGAGTQPRPPVNVELSISNLIRIGCLESTMFWRGAETSACVLVTPLGRSLVEACMPNRSEAAKAAK